MDISCKQNYIVYALSCLGFPGGPADNPGDARDAGSDPGSGRSTGGGNSNPLQNSCLENSMDRGAWQVAVHGVTKSQAGLSAHTLLLWQYLCDRIFSHGIMFSKFSHARMYQSLASFDCWIVFHCVYSFISWWALSYFIYYCILYNTNSNRFSGYYLTVHNQFV